jgi:hypothetical protein
MNSDRRIWLAVRTPLIKKGFIACVFVVYTKCWAYTVLNPAPALYHTKQQTFDPRFTRGLFVAHCASRHGAFQNRALKGATKGGQRQK